MTEETEEPEEFEAAPREPDRSKTIGDLAARMSAAMLLIHNPEPKGWNDFHKYKFISIGQVTELCREALANEGVMFLPTIVETKTWKPENDKQMYVVCTMEVMFIAADSGEWMRSSWKGFGADTSDKAYNKAYTAAVKQALTKTFLIADEVDPDSEAPDAPKQTGQSRSSNRRSSSKSSGSKKSKSKPSPKPDEEEGWKKANARFWAVTKELNEKASDLHEAFKAMCGIESSKDLKPAEYHRFIDKLEAAESLEKAADAMISKWAGEKREDDGGEQNEFDDDDIPF